MAILKYWTYDVDFHLLHRDRKWNWTQYAVCPTVNHQPIINSSAMMPQLGVAHQNTNGAILVEDVVVSLIKAVERACDSHDPVIWRSLEPRFVLALCPDGSVPVLEAAFRERRHWNLVAVALLLDCFNHIEDYQSQLDAGMGLLLYVSRDELISFHL